MSYKIAQTLYNVGKSFDNYDFPCGVNNKIRDVIIEVIYDFIELGGITYWKVPKHTYPFFKYSYDELIKDITNLHFPSLVFVGVQYPDKMKDLFNVLLKNYSIVLSLSHITSVYFGYCVSQKIKISSWIDQLITFLETLKDDIPEKDNEKYIRYIRMWRYYMENRFKDGKLVDYFTLRDIQFRTEFFIEIINRAFQEKNISPKFFALLSIYDSLLVCDGKFEKFVFYGMLNTKFSSLAGFLYGMIYGLEDVPSNLWK